MKTKIKISGYIVRSSAAALLFLCVVVALSSAINLPNHPPKFTTPQNNTAFDVNSHESASSVAASAIRRNRTLTFADRVAYQRAIEEVYWRHRIWPAANAGLKPSLDKVMSQEQIEKKVEDYLRNSQALEDYWQKPISPVQLQAEIERIANHTKQPEVLREIFGALGNDPLVIAECLARPILAERLITELYAHDKRFHGELKRRAEAELRTHPSVRQIKQTSGMHTEMEWIKSDSAETDSASADAKNLEAVKMNGSEWQESVENLAKEFDNAKAADSWGQIKTGVVSPLQEDDRHYYAVAIIKRGKDRLKLATVAWLKEPLRSWVAKAEMQVPVTMAVVSANYTLPVIASPSDACIDDTWTPTTRTNVPDGRYDHTAVWTGSEMIVWGGGTLSTYFNTGGRYNPVTDSWTATSPTNAPDARTQHTAVWTGSEMIVWGGISSGDSLLNTGWRYNPSTDSWVATSTTNPPAGRYLHTAVWTGNEMIVWGGEDENLFYLNTGGRYNPSADSWAATSTTNAPAAREDHIAVWTGSQMIVWGDYHGSNTGGRYNPSADSWSATSTANAPAGLFGRTAVWTGSQMIVWGARTGGRYDPSADSWTAVSTTNAPVARGGHTAVWTGAEMIIWGGTAARYPSFDLNNGGRYNPSTDSWTGISTTNAAAGRHFHTAVWTGSQMIVWGGFTETSAGSNTGGRYCATGPIAITNPATYIASFSASLNGSLNPRGLTTAVYFQYGTTTSYGQTTASQTTTGNTYDNVSANTSGLSASTTYHFRIVAANTAGTKYGSDRTFTTLSPTGPAVVTTNPATLIASFSAAFNGSLDPHGLTTNVHFQYGTTTSYGLATAPQSHSGNAYLNITANISSLNANTVYHFRIVATNSAGTRYGSDRTFTTLSAAGPPVVTTNAATNITTSSATLNGSLDPHGLTTTVHFQYGTTTSYTHATAMVTETGSTYRNIASNIGGLTMHTTYHFRIIATNSAGTRMGNDRTFFTP